MSLRSFRMALFVLQVGTKVSCLLHLRVVVNKKLAMLSTD